MGSPVRPPPAPIPAARRALARREGLLWLDSALLALAFLSLLILIVDRVIPLAGDEARALRWVDYAAILLFGLGFLGKLLSARNPVNHLLRNWYEAIAFLPLTVDILGLGRWFLLLQVAIVFTRFSEALDRAFGERILNRMFDRYKAMLVEELTTPLLVRLVVIIQNALVKGRYMESLGKNLDRRRPEIHAIVLKAVEANPKVARLHRIPRVKEAVSDAVEGVVDSAVASLTSEEMNRLISESLHEVFEDLKQEINKREWKERGVGVGQVTTGLFRRPDI